MNDAEIIELHGGPAALAAKLGFDRGAGGTQRVFNWKLRGIPPRVKLDRPDLFDTAVLAAMAGGKEFSDRSKGAAVEHAATVSPVGPVPHPPFERAAASDQRSGDRRHSERRSPDERRRADRRNTDRRGGPLA